MIYSGYTASFKMLVDKTGLECVVVTGTVPKQPGIENNGHAWCLIKVNSSWKVVDPPWNDTQGGDSDDEYLLLGPR